MLQEKHLIDSWRTEMFVSREDVITLMIHLHVPFPLHVSECPDLIECVSRLCNDFDIPHGKEDIYDILDDEIVSGVAELNQWNAIENSI